MATTISHVLHRASKPPTARVDAYLDRPALGTVVVDGLVSFITEDPAQLFAIADAALKAGQDLEAQQAKDKVEQLAREACAAGRHGYCDGQHHVAKAG